MATCPLLAVSSVKIPHLELQPVGTVRVSRVRHHLAPEIVSSPCRDDGAVSLANNGHAIRPVSSRCSTSNSAHSPALARINSTSHRGRPTPGTGRGEAGRALTHQRMVLAVGCPKFAASAGLRQRRMAMAMVPLVSAASWRRREGVIASRETSPTTPARPPAQTFLHAGQHLPVRAGVNAEHPIGVEARLGQGRGEQVRTDAPEDLPVGAREDSGREQGRRRPVQGAIAAPGDFMEGAQSQARLEAGRRFPAPRMAKIRAKPALRPRSGGFFHAGRPSGRGRSTWRDSTTGLAFCSPFVLSRPGVNWSVAARAGNPLDSLSREGKYFRAGWPEAGSVRFRRLGRCVLVIQPGRPCP